VPLRSTRVRVGAHSAYCPQPPHLGAIHPSQSWGPQCILPPTSSFGGCAPWLRYRWVGANWNSGGAPWAAAKIFQVALPLFRSLFHPCKQDICVTKVMYWSHGIRYVIVNKQICISVLKPCYMQVQWTRSWWKVFSFDCTIWIEEPAKLIYFCVDFWSTQHTNKAFQMQTCMGGRSLSFPGTGSASKISS